MAITKAITRDMILIGLKNGLVQLINSPHEDGPVCQIGEHWFYFSCFSEDDLEMTATQFRNSYKDEDIALAIFKALNEFPLEGLDDEYLYYYWYLVENRIPAEGEAELDDKLADAAARSGGSGNSGAASDTTPLPGNHGERTKHENDHPVLD